jgi:hypothetical protein
METFLSEKRVCKHNPLIHIQNSVDAINTYRSYFDPSVNVSLEPNNTKLTLKAKYVCYFSVSWDTPKILTLQEVVFVLLRMSLVTLRIDSFK